MLYLIFDVESQNKTVQIIQIFLNTYIMHSKKTASELAEIVIDTKTVSTSFSNLY